MPEKPIPTLQQRVSAAKIRQEALKLLDNAYKAEKSALSKLEKAERLLMESEIRMSNAKRVEELNLARAKKLDQMFIRLNKAKALVEQRTIRENERDLFLRDPIANI